MPKNNFTFWLGDIILDFMFFILEKSMPFQANLPMIESEINGYQGYYDQ